MKIKRPVPIGKENYQLLFELYHKDGMRDNNNASQTKPRSNFL